MIESPNNRGLLLRRTFPELDRSLIQRALMKFPHSLGRWVASKRSWEFHNGSVLEFGFCEKETDVFQYQSAEYGFKIGRASGRERGQIRVGHRGWRRGDRQLR